MNILWVSKPSTLWSHESSWWLLYTWDNAFHSSKSNCNGLQVEGVVQPQKSRRQNTWVTLQSKTWNTNTYLNIITASHNSPGNDVNAMIWQTCNAQLQWKKILVKIIMMIYFAFSKLLKIIRKSFIKTLTQMNYFSH